MGKALAQRFVLPEVIELVKTYSRLGQRWKERFSRVVSCTIEFMGLKNRVTDLMQEVERKGIELASRPVFRPGHEPA